MTTTATAPLVAADLVTELRKEVRAFIQSWWSRKGFAPGLGMNATHSPEFSLELAQRGWVGMAIPTQYGGRGSTTVERFVVAEELLAAGAPVGAHWVAERQTAPTLLVFGTEAQRQLFLPRIAEGRCFFSIGLSEPDSGSDLASVRTTARRVDGGWLVNGTKIWTSGAHRNHFFVVLCRTRPLADDRHEGLSQLIVDLKAPGLRISPIKLLNGSHHFNEVAFTDVFVPDDMLLGEEGSGWTQITSELAHERSGPDRFMSTYPLLEQLLRDRATDVEPAYLNETVGRLTARYWMIRQLSLAVAHAIDRGGSTSVQAAIVKDLGTTFEQDVVASIQALLELDPDPTADSLFERQLAEATLISPSYTIRGGTTEVLRSVAAKALRSTHHVR
ncbi:MAG: acyl-CoA dehydrogenase [Marmoricola sp.]|nr:acyl-CoA dehydrogenase [Marmoricola sp.]